MPYIPSRLRDCALYLYPSESAAQEGQDSGGSGFLVGVPSLTVSGAFHFYAVTNEHVVRPTSGRPNPVIRLTGKGGTADIRNMRTRAWLEHPDGDDVAATALALGHDSRINWISRDDFITPVVVDQYMIGPGDECFMVGRLLRYDGRQRNEPILRFGNLAMMPYPIPQLNRGRHQESFLVEMRTLSGFSGSPVIVYYVTVGTRDEPDAQADGSVALCQPRDQ